MTMRWTMRGQETGSIGVYTSEDCMRLKYSVNGEAVEQVIEWGWTDNPFGKRRWFVCPKCWRNCSVLYGGARFYCRKCWGLTYHSQYEEDWERLSGKAERLRHRLGGKGFISAGDPFNAPPKPKWMHWELTARSARKATACASSTQWGSNADARQCSTGSTEKAYASEARHCFSACLWIGQSPAHENNAAQQRARRAENFCAHPTVGPKISQREI